MINHFIAWVKSLLIKSKVANEPHTLELKLPNCESLTITLNWHAKYSAQQIEKAYQSGTSKISLHPFMTKSDYKDWLIDVLSIENIDLNNNDYSIKVINKRTYYKPIANVLPELVNRLEHYERQEGIRQSTELLVLLGRLRRALSKVKIENVGEKENALYNQLLINFDNEFDRLPQWLVQFEAIKNRTWSEG